MVVATLAFVVAHSLQVSVDSWAESNAVAALFDPVLHRAYDLFCAVFSWAGHAAPLTYEAFVRKTAHFVEYAVLGAECAGLAIALSKRVISPYLWMSLFAVLMAAVLDEAVQSFTGRTSLVSDVLLDFTGGLVGIAVVLLVVALVFKRNST